MNKKDLKEETPEATSDDEKDEKEETPEEAPETPEKPEESPDKEEEEVDEKKEIVSVSKALRKSLAEDTKKVVKEVLEAKKEEKEDKVINKNIGCQSGEDKEGDKKTKAVKFVKFLKSLAEGDITAAKALNEGVTEEGGALVPPADFIAELVQLEEEHGVAMRNCRIRRTDRTTVEIPTQTGQVAVYETDEKYPKTESEPEFDLIDITVKKYAAITALSDELEEDSAIDIWNEIAQDYADAFARTQDELVFTDATIGLLNIAGTNAVTIDGDSIEDITFDDLVDATCAVPTKSMRNGKFYFHRTILCILQKLKSAVDGHYIWQPGPNGAVDGTIWGHPYELVDVMPGLEDDDDDTGFIVFGDLNFYMLVLRNNMTLKVLEEGTVGSNNLGEQDMKALRAVQRFYGEALIPDAFAVIKTAATGS